MKTIYTSLMISAIAFISGCNPNHPTPGTPSSYKVKTIMIAPITPNANSYYDTITFTYDGLGRILTIRPKRNANSEATNTYNGTTMLMDNHWNSGSGDVSGVLNSQNLLVSGICDYHGMDPSVTTQCVYDTAGFLQVQNTSVSTTSETKTFHWQDSCLVSILDQTSSGISQTVTFTYYPNQREYRDYGLETWLDVVKADFLFQQALVVGTMRSGHSKYLLKTRTDSSGTLNYSYTFDQYGRVSTQTETFSGGGSILTYTYY
ncbi:MAG: hypothetical protein JST83_03300 [Bacteroidetes bacterium]|nr:hypothetical protein [Bacteroidota bacterium]